MRKRLEQVRLKGQGLVEYALILVLIGIVVILVLSLIGQRANLAFSKIGSTINP